MLIHTSIGKVRELVNELNFDRRNVDPRDEELKEKIRSALIIVHAEAQAKIELIDLYRKLGIWFLFGACHAEMALRYLKPICSLLLQDHFYMLQQSEVYSFMAYAYLIDEKTRDLDLADHYLSCANRFYLACRENFHPLSLEADRGFVFTLKCRGLYYHYRSLCKDNNEFPDNAAAMAHNNFIEALSILSSHEKDLSKLDKIDCAHLKIYISATNKLLEGDYLSAAEELCLTLISPNNEKVLRDAARAQICLLLEKVSLRPEKFYNKVEQIVQHVFHYHQYLGQAVQQKLYALMTKFVSYKLEMELRFQNLNKFSLYSAKSKSGLQAEPNPRLTKRAFTM